MEMKRHHQSKISFRKGKDKGQDEATERKRKREGDGDERGRAGTGHCVQDRISIIFNVLFNITKTFITFILFMYCLRNIL